jgi:multiple sugar transport system ATP-binding protein
MASVTFENVSKRFTPDIAVVDRLDLEVKDGEFMAFVGPSGCGKSTSLRMLAGLEAVTDGTIRIGDRDVTHLPPVARDIAMVFQSYALYPHMTVAGNMSFGLKMRHTPKPEIIEKVGSAASTLALENYLQRKPEALSGGQRQRVALGRAIVRRPQVFLLDEPLSNLDAALRGETRLNLMRLHRTLGATFIYVTHDQVEAMTMGDRIAVMNLGMLQQVASPMDLYERPKNMYVAGFIGSPRMSFVPVTIEGTRVRATGFDFDLPKPVASGKAFVGLRPEMLRYGQPDGLPTELQVDVCELLGSDQYVYGKLGDDDVIARLSPHLRPQQGDRLPLTIDLRRIHLFDAETQLAIEVKWPE